MARKHIVIVGAFDIPLSVIERSSRQKISKIIDNLKNTGTLSNKDLLSIDILYCIVWRSYEESLKVLLKISFDLINLIPEEIKYLIVTKLNE